MNVVKYSVGMLETNGFILHENLDAVIVDPGDEPEVFLDHCADNGLIIHAILITHGHADHIGAVGVLRRKLTSALVMCHPNEAPYLVNPELNMSIFAGKRLNVGAPDKTFVEGEILRFGKLELEVRHVPGHTLGHVVFISGNNAIVGDTLFAGGIGRWDLPGGNGTKLVNSIKRQLLSLPDETIIWPGHGPCSTILEERSNNPYLISDIDSNYIDF